MALGGLPEHLVAQIRSPPPAPSPQQLQDRAEARLREALLSEEGFSAEGLVFARIHTCSALLRATRASAKILSSAGEGLQRSVGAVRADAGFRKCLAPGGVPVARVGCDLLEACSNLGVALSSLSAVLASELAEPLQHMRDNILEDCRTEQAEVLGLEQAEAACTLEVRDSAARKDKASYDLQNAMQENAKLQSALPGFLTRLTSSKLESQVQQAAAVQTAAVEDLALKMDKQAVARMQRERAMTTFQEFLSTVDGRFVTTFRSALDRCSGAWTEAAGDLQDIAKRLRNDAQAEATAAAAAAAAAAQAAVESSTARLCGALDEGVLASRVPLGQPNYQPTYQDLYSKAHFPPANSVLAPQHSSQQRHLAPPAPEVVGARSPSSSPREPAPQGDSVPLLSGNLPAVGSAEAAAVAGIGEALTQQQDGEASPEQSTPQFGEAIGSRGAQFAPYSDAAAGSPEASPLSTPPRAATREPSPQMVGRSAAVLAEADVAGSPLVTAEPQPPPLQPAQQQAVSAASAEENGAIVVRFSEQVKRLGFEVLWEAERPMVGNVVPEGAAQKNGLLPGDVLLKIAGADTLGKSRDNLMPLLKVRPLAVHILRDGRAASAALGD